MKRSTGYIIVFALIVLLIILLIGTQPSRGAPLMQATSTPTNVPASACALGYDLSFDSGYLKCWNPCADGQIDTGDNSEYYCYYGHYEAFGWGESVLKSQPGIMIEPDASWFVTDIDMLMVEGCGGSHDANATVWASVYKVTAPYNPPGDLVGKSSPVLLDSLPVDDFSGGSGANDDWVPVSFTFSPSIALSDQFTYIVVLESDDSAGCASGAVTIHWVDDPDHVSLPSWVVPITGQDAQIYCTGSGTSYSACSTNGHVGPPIALYGSLPTPTRTPYAAPTATNTPVPPTATPTPDPNQPPRIEELFPCQGPTCRDWNLRSFCGDNDLYVKISAYSVMNLADYKVAIYDAADTEICLRILAADNLTFPIKTIFLDEMYQPSGVRCDGWPLTGYVQLFDPDGALLDRVDYDME